MNGKRARGRSPLWRAAAIVGVIVCYMAILTAISYARGPEHWRPAEPPVLESGAFTSFAGEAAGENGPLPMENGPDGQAVGHQAEVELIGGAALQVSLKVECPAEYAGNTLIVDLYNDQVGYDDPAQERGPTNWTCPWIRDRPRRSGRWSGCSPWIPPDTSWRT